MIQCNRDLVQEWKEKYDEALDMIAALQDRDARNVAYGQIARATLNPNKHLSVAVGKDHALEIECGGHTPDFLRKAEEVREWAAENGIEVWLDARIDESKDRREPFPVYYLIIQCSGVSDASMIVLKWSGEQ